MAIRNYNNIFPIPLLIILDADFIRSEKKNEHNIGEFFRLERDTYLDGRSQLYVIDNIIKQ